MSLSLPTPLVLNRYLDENALPVLPAARLRWEGGREHLWELPEGVCLVGPPPEQFGIRVDRQAPDLYATHILWNGTRLSWPALTRVQLLTSALVPLLRSLGNDLVSLLDQPVRGGSGSLRKVA
jgi:hypothetical protein